MPRPNQPRTVDAEGVLARRIAYEREKRTMTYDSLASRMSEAGCSIQASALYKIEKGTPPRRITVDELVAVSRVFGIPIPRLLLPPEVAASREALGLWEEYGAASRRHAEAREQMAKIESRLLDVLDGDPTGAVMEALRGQGDGGELSTLLPHMRLYRAYAEGNPTEVRDG